MGDILKYYDEVKRSMDFLAQQEKTIFIGQSVGYPGNVIYKTISHIDSNKKIELPVMEESQLGMSIGLAMEGFIPISVFPRFNFLLLAMNQLVNHLDKIPTITNGKLKPRVIIKTMVGSKEPLHPGIQHCGDFTDAFKLLLGNIEVVHLDRPEDIFPAYKHALDRKDSKSSIIVEVGDYYTKK
jgi:pyruvate/2-oxoglutarate/acetoin dehydrogenase E1 component